MTIKDIRENEITWEEEFIVNKEFTFLKEKGNFLGWIRNGEQVKAIFLLDGKLERENEQKRIKLYKKRKKGLLTHREEILAGLKEEKTIPFQIRGIKFQGKEYLIESTAKTCITEDSVREKIILLSFIKKGLQFGELEDCELQNLFLAEMQICGEYEEIPFQKKGGQDFEFLSDLSYPFFAEKKINLKIGEENYRKYRIKENEAGVNYEFYIEKVYLEDLWEDIKRILEDPNYIEKVTPEQLDIVKKTFLEYLEENCPREKRYAVIEYESDEISLQFYAKDYLKEKINMDKSCATAMFWLMKPEKKLGKHGKKLRSCMLEYPVDKDIKEIEVEILGGYKNKK